MPRKKRKRKKNERTKQDLQFPFGRASGALRPDRLQGNGSSSGETEGADSALASLPEESSPDSESTESEAGTSGSGESSAGESSLSSEENSGVLAESEEFNAKFAENLWTGSIRRNRRRRFPIWRLPRWRKVRGTLGRRDGGRVYGLMEASGEDAGWKAEQEAWLSSRPVGAGKTVPAGGGDRRKPGAGGRGHSADGIFPAESPAAIPELYEYQPEFSFAWSPEAGSSDGEE